MLSQYPIVYGIGAIIWNMLHPKVRDGYPRRTRGTDKCLHYDGEESVNNLCSRAILGRYYQTDLFNLVESCLEFNPQDRPTLVHLRQSIVNGIQNHNLAPVDWPAVPVRDTVTAQNFRRLPFTRYPQKLEYPKEFDRIGSRRAHIVLMG